MAKGGIYKIYFRQNPTKFYIGSAVDFTERKARHRYQLKIGKHKNSYLLRCYNKYGRENFVFEVIEYCNNSSLLVEKEQKYINELNPKLNILKIAGSCLGYKHSQEAKEKISVANRGRKMTQEQIQKGVIARIGQKTSLGCKRTEKVKKHLSEINKRSVVNNKTGQIIDSIGWCAEILGLKYQTLYAKLSKRNNNNTGWSFYGS